MYKRHMVTVPKDTILSQYEKINNVIVLSAKDCYTHYEFWII